MGKQSSKEQEKAEITNPLLGPKQKDVNETSQVILEDETFWVEELEI